jgi:hypothetical protein
MADVSAAAAAMGLPEALVERSVQARAAASGSSVDDLLTAWAGGEAPPPGGEAPAPADETAAAPEPASVEPATDEPEAAPPPTPEIVIDLPAAIPAPAPTPAGPYKPPVLVGARDNPMRVFWGVLGLFLIVVMVGLVGPSIPIDAAGARSSDIPFSEAALRGRALYDNLGCAACHTQMVRPVVADVGLGPVSLDDTNQVLGTTRYGPDLADVGFRVTASQIEAIISGLGSHPAQTLTEDDLSSLVAYLVESNTSAVDEDVEEEPVDEEGEVDS